MDQKKQVKDYYKILGVKPIASPEEIHARWIELMRKFHPDRGKYEALEDERAREINEAYGVLKDSSSRSEYDLRRAYQRKKKSLYLQRVITPPAVFIILLILALVYLQRPGSVRPAKSSLPSTRGSIQNKTNPLSSPVVNGVNVPNQTNPNETDQIDQRDQTNQIDQRKSPRHPNPTPTSKSQQSPHIKTRTNQTNETDEIDETNQTDQIDQKDQIIQPLPMSVSKERKAYPLFAKAKTSVTVNNATPSPSELSHRDEINLINQTNQTDQIDGTDEIDQIDEKDEIDQIGQIAALDSLTEPDFLKAPNQPNLIAETDQIDQITEEEVRQFLEHYRDRYVHQDIDGFLSLFSSKAVQNGREGFDEIKKIYSDFFHQSHEIQYHLEDTRIEIYQEVLISGLFYEHAALVEARYQVDQTLAKKGEKRVWRGDIRWILVRENGALKILYLRFKHKESA